MSSRRTRKPKSFAAQAAGLALAVPTAGSFSA
jgi:hypothetical protein